MTAITAVEPERAPPRIELLDVLRGFALFGMIVVHFHQRVHTEVTGLEDLIGWAVWVGLESKAWGTFAFLFGVGFAVLLRRSEAKGQPFVAFYLRRLAVLALFGVAAEVLFGFQVLLGYALWGVPLLLLHRLSTRALLGVACFALVAGLLLAAGRESGLLPLAGAAEEARTLLAAVESAGAGESYTQLVAARFDSLLFRYLSPFVLVPDVTLALFIFGLLALRVGLVDDPRGHVKMIVGWMTFGFLCWAFSWLVLYRLDASSGPAALWLSRLGYALIRDQWLCFTFMGAIALLLAYRPVWRSRLEPFGLAGRMALTNYMLQVAVLDYVVSGYGLSLRVRPVIGIFGAALLFGVEVAFSRWWLARYRYGPLEWVWRSLTYWKRQPMRKVVPGALAEVAV
jgi:uncharacterized protein